MKITFDKSSRPSKGQKARLREIAQNFNRLFENRISLAHIIAEDHCETIEFYTPEKHVFTIEAVSNKIDGGWLEMEVED